jgi:16S rRNA A1518/A1519 N6-dimethyltransferase RsmA/KsgA/DIM1 with predicted DNA glycosylase/AP lyase activity
MIRPVPERRAGLEVAWFQDIVRKIFQHRRKNLRHMLSGLWGSRWTKSDVDLWLGALGLDGKLRAEALPAEQIRQLAEALKARWGAEVAKVSGEVIHEE